MSIVNEGILLFAEEVEKKAAIDKIETALMELHHLTVLEYMEFFRCDNTKILANNIYNYWQSSKQK